MFGIGVQEFGLILVVALLVFGPKRLPELARMLGRGMGEFRRASNDLRQSLALDDLQNDLRKDLNSAQSILKPDLRSILDPEDPGNRPPQAGDELESPSNDQAPEPTSESDSAPQRHPGELPLGNDHAHHSEPELEADAENHDDDHSDGAASSAMNESKTAPLSANHEAKSAVDPKRG